MSLFIDADCLFMDRKASPNRELKIEESNCIEVGQDDSNKSEPGTPKPNPMAFTIDFGDAKEVDKGRLEKLAKKSQARHQRVQSMSASLTRSSPVDHKPPMSAKLPRKAQGYNSEGYFSSDQEDSVLSGSVKLRQSFLAAEKINLKSPVNENVQIRGKVSRSPIVDSIMSRSDILPSKQNLNLPLKHTNSSYMQDVHRTSSYSNLWPNNQSRLPMADIIDQSPEGVMLNDISSPEFDLLTPDNCLSTPEGKSPYRKLSRPSSVTPDLLFPNKSNSLYIDDNDLECQSNNSSTGTYTIEGDNYTEEQKARMSIDRTFGGNKNKQKDRDPELIFDYHKKPKDVNILSPKRSINDNFETSSKSMVDRNILEVSCCYEPPADKDLAAQTSKQIKSTRSYLEKIKNRVKNITEKTFAKSPPKLEDLGCFTSVTTSGVLNSKKPLQIEHPRFRRCSLTNSEIDQTDYVHRLSRESSVPVNLPSNQILPTKFESTALRTAHAKLTEDSSDINQDVAGKLSYLSLNRCKGDKTWIQEWADSVKNYNRNSLQLSEGLDTVLVEGQLPPQSPRHLIQERTPRVTNAVTTKIPSPVSTYGRNKKDQVPVQDTEAYLLKTQNAISNLQAKLQSGRPNNFATIPTIPPQLTSSLISEKTLVSRLPVSQLSRSNSLNYRLRRREPSADSSPLRSPGHYVITGSSGLPNSTKILLNNVTRSLDDDPNMNSPVSHSSDDKTLSHRPYERKTHVRHKSIDNRNQHTDLNNANTQVSLKTVLKNQAQNAYVPPRNIEQSRGNLRDGKRGNHQRNFSDNDKALRRIHSPTNAAFGMSIRRSSSFNTVNKNNNYLEPSSRLTSRYNDQDYLSDDSEVDQNKSDDVKHKKITLRARLDADLNCKTKGKCPNTPEMQRKFGPGLVRNSMRVTSRERGLITRMSEPPISKEERQKGNHQSRISESTRQAVMNRLTKSRSSTRELQPKSNQKATKKSSQYRSASALASKEQEFTNWKKRSSYDPMKAALEGKRRQQQVATNKRQDFNKDDLSSPSHSSPVHRSQSFHSTNLADLDAMDSSSEETDDDNLLCHLPTNHPMITSTHSDILDLRPKAAEYKEVTLRRQALNNDVVLARDYVASFKVNKPPEKLSRRDVDKRKTFIVDADITPTKDNVDFLKLTREDPVVDKRKTFILDSDTNSTTNGSSPRNSSIFSHEKHSLTTATSDTEGESGTESAPVMLRHNKKTTVNNNPTKRYSGDYSMSSSTTSISQSQKRPKDIQPKYLDISKYKNENSSKNFLRRDPSKTYVGVLNNNHGAIERKGSAQQIEMEQKKQELEKWKRRASYDPRKAAALSKTVRTPNKTASSVLRSQSFHGPVLTSVGLQLSGRDTHDLYDQSSDNDF